MFGAAAAAQPPPLGGHAQFFRFASCVLLRTLRWLLRCSGSAQRSKLGCAHPLTDMVILTHQGPVVRAKQREEQLANCSEGASRGG